MINRLSKAIESDVRDNNGKDFAIGREGSSKSSIYIAGEVTQCYTDFRMIPYDYRLK